MSLTPFNFVPQPTPGDGLPFSPPAWVSMYFRDVPAEFRFGALSDIVGRGEWPLSSLMWDRLATDLDAWFGDFEVVGSTLADFFDSLKKSWTMHGDTFERLLEVYDSDIAKPILGRTETVTYGSSDDPLTTVNVRTDSEIRENEGSHIDVPVDGTVGNPTFKDIAKSKVVSGSVEDRSTQSGTLTRVLSDLGVRPNYESLNGFLDNNRTALKVLTDIFKNSFTLTQTMRW